MKNKLLILLLLSNITFIHVSQLLNNEQMRSIAHGVVEGTLVFIFISLIYCWSNISLIQTSPKIIRIILYLGIISVLSTFININNYNYILVLSITANLLYWIAAFSIAYVIISKYPHLNFVTINGFWLTFFIITYFYFNIVMFMSVKDSSGYYSLNESYYLLLLLPFILMLRKNNLKFIGIIIIVVAVVLSNKRTGSIALAGALLIYYWITLRSKSVKRNKLLLYASTIISIVVLFYVFNYISTMTNAYLLGRFEDISRDEGSGRVGIWSATVELQLHSSYSEWIIGHGYDSVAKSLSNFSAHNDFLEVLYDYGILGFTLYISIYYQLVLYCIKMKKYGYKYFNSFGASIFLFLILSFFSHLIIYPTYFIYLVFFWGSNIAFFENELKITSINSHNKYINYLGAVK